VHYWLTPKQLEKLVQRLQAKALNVILIGRRITAPVHKSPADLGFVRKLFSEWNEVQMIDGQKHFSVLFHNPALVTRSVDDLFSKQQFFTSRFFLPSFSKLIDDILQKRPTDPLKSEYYQYLFQRCKEQKERSTKLLHKHMDLIHSMNHTGIENPLIIGRIVNGKYESDRLTDGDHRLIVAKKLGFKSVVCKILPHGSDHS
jgi:hypothetical protein